MLCSLTTVLAQSEPEEDYDPEAKLEKLGITLPAPPKPVANYVNGVRAGNLIFLAGKGPRYADGTEITGKLGQDVSIEKGYEGARLTAINQLAVLKDMLGNLNKVKRIVKVLGMVNCDFDGRSVWRERKARESRSGHGIITQRTSCGNRAGGRGI